MRRCPPWIVPEERSNGHATASAELALEYAFDDRSLHEVFPRVIDGNDPSINVLERLRFRQEGHLREHCRLHGGYSRLRTRV